MTTEDSPRAWTTDEVRDHFLNQIAALQQYWLHEDRCPGVEEKLGGLVHSILTVIDGGSHLPGFVLAPAPHPDDEGYLREQGENWYPSGAGCDIGGALHEEWSRREAANANR